MEKFVIIDGNNLMFRAFYALPQLANFDGEISNAVFGFANMLVKVINDVCPKYIAVTFDVSKDNFRREKYPEYKGTRKPTPTELLSQFPIVKEMLKKMNITVVEKYGLEADDLMGCLSRMFDTKNIIVSADRDAFQLINDNTEIMFPKKGITETIQVTNENLKDIYGVNPNQVVDLKSLMGDSSDNIPGVSGVGEKKALQLLNDYKTLEGVYDNIDNITGKLKDNLIQDKDKAFLSYFLATIVTDEKLDYKLEDFEYDYPFSVEVLDMFKRYQFNSLIRRKELFEESEVKLEQTSCEEVIVDNLELLQELKKDILSKKEFCLYLDTNNFSIFTDKAYKINLSVDLLSMGLSFDIVIAELKDIFTDKDIEKIVFDSKELKRTLYNLGVNLNGVVFDCVLARYLINSIAKSNIDISTMQMESGLQVSNNAYALKLLKDLYYAKLEKMALLPLYYNIELPLVDVLFDMEQVGFKLDKDALDEIEVKYRLEINELEDLIYAAAGHKFNISSPKQLAEVLFDELNINIASNKKRSTSIDVLQEIENKHPIVTLIIKWRTKTKLYSTYIVGFQNILDSNHKIHTIFNQTLTATGRLSSSEPNLQNIPVRSDEGRALRKVFVSSFKDGLICSADYSQIELRLLAAFSGDEKLINAFNSGLDIHTMTASEIFGVAYEDVTSTMRRDAKAINFGIVYGISDFGLSQNIGITRSDAKKYIQMYFERYPKIDGYLSENVNFAKENGYAKTLFGRVRAIPEISSTNYNLRTFGERVAMNMPLQGSASDIIKLAMIKIAELFADNGLKSKIIVQVHDELVVDVYPGELEEVQRILKLGMENVVDLAVKLSVNIEYGKTWYDAK